MADNSFITLFTAQTQVVINTIQHDGFSRVKRAFIKQKYGAQAWVFQQAYAFFTQYASRFVERPEGAESGIWCFKDWRLALTGTGCSLLELSVPRSRAVLFDSRVWNRMLNLEYIGRNEEDENAFAKRIAAMGLKTTADAFTTSFYPTIKYEILQSWQQLFTSAEKCPENYLQAGLWELRKEWIIHIHEEHKERQL